jgi:hypothetical protein
MMPNLGQGNFANRGNIQAALNRVIYLGGCQAIEDAYVLSDLLSEITDKSQIPDALQTYYR